MRGGDEIVLKNNVRAAVVNDRETMSNRAFYFCRSHVRENDNTFLITQICQISFNVLFHELHHW